MSSDFKAFIEAQFPVSKVSKESYKERKAVSGQTLTGLGKWWGRKPLILVRATIIGLLMPASDDAERDREIFLKILTMDDAGLWERAGRSLPVNTVLEILGEEEVEGLITQNDLTGRWNWLAGITETQREDISKKAFLSLNYDQRLQHCVRPEHMPGPSYETWQDINAHLGTSAKNINELVHQLGVRQFGHAPRVGDAFCGGGSIPFEAARLGCEAYASDLNPAAALLTWASLNIVGGGKEVRKKVMDAQEKAFATADRQITEWGIEHNEKGWRADAYLYCVEARSPHTGYMVPLAPSWVVAEKNNVCAVLRPDHDNKRYHIDIVTDADAATFKAAKSGTVQSSNLICPSDPQKTTPISTLRGDRRVDKQTIYGLRQWVNSDLVPSPEDVFQERLYCIRYIETYYVAKGKIEHGKKKWKKDDELTKAEAEALPNLALLLESKMLKRQIRRHYVAPDQNDLQREQKVLKLLNERFERWQTEGYIPSKRIERGYNTEQPIRERGWTYWHHLFNPRQLLTIGVIAESAMNADSEPIVQRAVLLITPRLANLNSRLCRWLQTQGGGIGGGKETFDNMALNTLFNNSTRAWSTLNSAGITINEEEKLSSNRVVETSDARVSNKVNDIWVTDPPYADAVNYHEIGDFFLSWYEKRIPKLFPEWYADSKAAMAVKGSGKGFNESMVECYGNFTRHMPDNGAQVVMFTHQDAGVWADLALILWAAGLHVSAAWTIQTETDSVGIKTGNYVQGTVIMVLRKQRSEEVGFLSDIQALVEQEVREQLRFMTALDEEDDPNFGDADYQLAAYAAALRVLTGYKRIEDIDVNYELGRERKKGEENEVEKIIRSAVKVAMDFLVPTGFDEHQWRKLQPEERFYLKGLQVEAHGECRTGVYQEMARGFGLREYKNLLGSGKANMARLRTPLEFKNRDLGSDGFGSSLTRNILFAIYETHQTEDPQMGRNWLHNELPDYWGNRQLILHILTFIVRHVEHIEHWSLDMEALSLLMGRIENDHI